MQWEGSERFFLRRRSHSHSLHRVYILYIVHTVVIGGDRSASTASSDGARKVALTSTHISDLKML